MKKTLSEMIEFCRQNNLGRFVEELRAGDTSEKAIIGAVTWVYDQHTLSAEDFRNKYFA